MEWIIGLFLLAIISEIFGGNSTGSSRSDKTTINSSTRRNLENKETVVDTKKAPEIAEKNFGTNHLDVAKSPDNSATTSSSNPTKHKTTDWWLIQRRSLIYEISKRRQVPYLVHFTRAENLRSIITNGIYPLSRVNEVCRAPKINDTLRLDGRPDGISLSVAFPNSKMLYKYRMENKRSEWVILMLHTSILLSKNCAFCKHNAADARISKQPIELLKTSLSFLGMFDEIQGLTSRAEQNLNSFDPTDVQAEVLVFDVIEPSLITGIVFDSVYTKEKYVSVVGNRNTWIHANNKHFFASRNYARKFSTMDLTKQEIATHG